MYQITIWLKPLEGQTRGDYYEFQTDVLPEMDELLEDWFKRAFQGQDAGILWIAVERIECIEFEKLAEDGE